MSIYYVLVIFCLFIISLVTFKIFWQRAVMLVKTVDPLLARMGGAGDQIANFARIDSHSKSVHSMPCRPIVLSGPSGGGKSTILNRAMAEYPSSFAFSVSHTTRKPREGEQHGVHYWFTERSEMDKMIVRGDFLEYATFGGNTYGTSVKAVDDVEKTGRICVLDVELQGVRNIKNSHLNARYFLIRPPSLKALEERLRARGTEKEEDIAKRLHHAQQDLEAVNNDPTLFDLVIINDDLEAAYNQFIAAIQDDLNVSHP